MKPYFLITIDTEGDDLWSRPRVITTRNADYLERFQLLCESHGLRPTWLADHEMIQAPRFRRFARAVLEAGTAEIGMHLHAWNSPPVKPLTKDDFVSQPYLLEYPPDVMREKIHALTARLEDVLGVKMVSHRAGRWGLDERYAEMLIEEGYSVDCSVTPLVSWRASLGSPTSGGGPDYRLFPRHPYWLDPGDISKPGASPLLEVPVTVVAGWPTAFSSFAAACERLPRPVSSLASFSRRAARRLVPETVWLRPNGRNVQHLLRALRRVVAERMPHAQFVLHSSELMPGGSPTFTTMDRIERLYGDLDRLFGEARTLFQGATLAEFHRRFAGQAP